MPYLRRLVLLLTLSTSLLLVTVHLLHFSRPRHQDEPLHPVISKEQAEKDFSYLKQYDHPIKPEDLKVPSRDYAYKIVYGKEPPIPPKKEDLHLPGQEDSKPKPTPKPEEQKDLKADQKDSNPEQKDSKTEPTSKQDIQKDSKPEPNPTEQEISKTKLKLNDRPPLPESKIAPPNATAWHKDKNLWKVVDALNG